MEASDAGEHCFSPCRSGTSHHFAEQSALDFDQCECHCVGLDHQTCFHLLDAVKAGVSGKDDGRPQTLDSRQSIVEKAGRVAAGALHHGLPEREPDPLKRGTKMKMARKR